MKKKCFGFTLAEVLITLAIIGVVAAITIPSVIVNTNQMEFKTGLRKAVSVLNQSITLNKALTGETPYDNEDLYRYLQQNMSVMKKALVTNTTDASDSAVGNASFYTTDGMRFEFFLYGSYRFPLHENPSVHACSACSTVSTTGGAGVYGVAGKCGSLGLAHNPDSTTNSPCVIAVDVNGDRKPNPQKITSNGVVTLTSHSLGEDTVERLTVTDGYKYADPNGRLLTDIFSIMITDQGAIPYGVVAQKAMYQAQK